VRVPRLIVAHCPAGGTLMSFRFHVTSALVSSSGRDELHAHAHALAMTGGIVFRTLSRDAASSIKPVSMFAGSTSNLMRPSAVW